MGSSCFSQAPLHLSQLPFSSSSSSSFCPSSCSLSASIYIRNVVSRKRSRAWASLRREDPKSDCSCKRRAILILGVSVLPFLQLKAKAVASLAPEKTEIKTPEENQNAELELQSNATPNHPSLLDGIGIFSSGVLGALYALARKEKMATNETIESMETKLRDKEATMRSMEKNFESKLLNEKEERTKQLKKAKEEQLSLVDQLNSANSTISGLGQEIKNEKRTVEELKFNIDSLQTALSKAGEEKKALEEILKENLKSIELLQDRVNLLSLELKDNEDTIRNLKSSLAEKDSELKNLISSYYQAKDELGIANAEIKEFKDELLKNKKELEIKISLVDELNARVGSLIVERDASKRRSDDLLEEYNSLKLSSERKELSDAKLLREKETEIEKLEKNLAIAVNEAAANGAIISDLTREREDLQKKLEIESSSVKSLKHELEITQETLTNSRNEASDLAKQFERSKEMCKDLVAEISRVNTEFSEVRESLQKSLEEIKLNSEALTSELTATKEHLDKTKKELEIASDELKSVADNRELLQKELVEAYKKAEASANELKEEKKTVSSLNKELQTWEKQNLKDKEARKSLETDLEEATKSLDEMNRNALILSRDLEKAYSRISNLEDEKEVLYKSLAEQKNASKEAKENMEDAHNLVMRLGKERESLQKRAKKLEEELASAKGEILRLRSKINSSKVVANNQPQQNGEPGGNASVTAKRVVRRRRAGSQ